MEKSENYLILKILFLALFFLLLNSWLTYHVGNDFLETYFTNGILVFIGIVGFLVKYLKKDNQEKIKDKYNSWLSALLNFQVLAGLYILLFMFGSFVSSVHITTDKTQMPGNLILYTPGNSDNLLANMKIPDDDPIIKKTVLTIPFGKTFLLNANGYQEHSFQVYPWTGKRINMEKDMLISPTIIGRVPVDFFMQLSRLKLNVQHNTEQAVTYNLDNHAAILLGQMPEIPDTYFEKWQIELRGSYEESVIIYNSLNKWTIQEPLFILMDFQVNDSIKLELTTASSEILATSNGIIGSEQFNELHFKILN